MTKRAKGGKAGGAKKIKDLDPKGTAKKVKGGAEERGLDRDLNRVMDRDAQRIYNRDVNRVGRNVGRAIRDAVNPR